MRLEAISYTAIQDAVAKVLATNKWPILETHDDAGLTQRDYVKFVSEVLTKLRNGNG